jgi:hypothetical protein
MLPVRGAKPAPPLTSNPCAEVRLLPGPLRGKVLPALRAMMTFPSSQFDFAVLVLLRRAKPAALSECGSVERSSPAAAGTNPLGDRLRVRALSARMCLLPCPARPQPHRPVPAWALLRLELRFLLRVRQVRDILGKAPSAYGFLFQWGSACMQGDGRLPTDRAHLR